MYALTLEDEKWQVSGISCRVEFKTNAMACLAIFGPEYVDFYQMSSPRSRYPWMPGGSHAYGECLRFKIKFSYSIDLVIKTHAFAGMGCSKNYTSRLWEGRYVKSVATVPLYIGRLPQWW